jgi:hypothetical protein
MQEELLHKIEQYKKELKIAGIGKNFVKILKDKINKATEPELLEINAWFQHMIKVDLQNCMKAYKLIPVDQWKMYKLMDIKGTQEQILFKNATNTLLENWRERYAEEIKVITSSMSYNREKSDTKSEDVSKD